MNLIWPIIYVLISIVSEPEGTLEMSFWKFFILPPGKKDPRGWRGQARGAAHRSTGQRTKLPDPWPSARTIKRRENDKNWCLLYFSETFHWVWSFVWFFPLGEKKSITIQYWNSFIRNYFSIAVKEDTREGHSTQFSPCESFIQLLFMECLDPGI